jgi:hydroxyacylglutathione hydrolase
MISIKNIITGKWKENCYIVYSSNKETLIIDPGSNASEIIQFVKENDLKILAILNTHAHYDHIGGIYELKETFSVPFYLHSEDQKLLKSANLYKAIFDGEHPIKIPQVDYYFDQIKTPVQLGEFTINVIFTPGHTKGGVCFCIEDMIFTGDTLLEGHIGRVDLPGGNKLTLLNSLKILSTLPKDHKVFSGHGKETTIAHELANNKRFSEVLSLVQ